MKKNLFALLGLCSMLALTPAMSDEMTAHEQADETAYKAIDPEGKGKLNMGDIENFRDLVFTSADANDDNKLTMDEFLSWDTGYIDAAKDIGRAQALNTARKIVFAFWDRDGDGAITPDEHRKSIAQDFKRADINDDGNLSKDEMLNGFMIIVATKAALAPTK